MKNRILTIAACLLFCGAVFAADCGWNVLDAGAVGDGKTDNTAAFQKALEDAAAAGGGVVHVPAGHYRFDGELRIPGAVTLQGTFRTPPTDQREARPRLDGSVLQIYAGRGNADGTPFVTFTGSMATVAGVIFQYPEWRQEDVPPVPYPPTVRADHLANVAVLDCLFLNSYAAIHFQHTGRFIVRNVFGYPSYRGLYTDFCLDISRIENVHFWPFGVHYKHDDPFCEWVNINGIAFEFARTDWQYVLNTFCFGYGVGYKFSEAADGPANGSFIGIGADSCRRAVLVENAQYPGLLITNGEFVGRWGSKDSVGVEVASSAGDTKVSLVNCSFWGPLDQCIRHHSKDAQLSVTASHFANWDNTGRGAAAVQVDAGKAILQGNTFRDGDVHIHVGEDVRSAIILGNQAEGGLRVENRAGDRTQQTANEVGRQGWAREMLRHYCVDVGAPGDRPFIRRWHGREPALEWPSGDGTKRWSMPDAALVLPVQPGVAYTLQLDVYLPEPALGRDNAVLVNGQPAAVLPQEAGTHEMRISIPALDGEEAVILVQGSPWVPGDVIPDNHDRRTLGIALRRAVMLAENAPPETPCVTANVE